MEPSRNGRTRTCRRSRTLLRPTLGLEGNRTGVALNQPLGTASRRARHLPLSRRTVSDQCLQLDAQPLKYGYRREHDDDRYPSQCSLNGPMKLSIEIIRSAMTAHCRRAGAGRSYSSRTGQDRILSGRAGWAARLEAWSVTLAVLTPLETDAKARLTGAGRPTLYQDEMGSILAAPGR